MNHLSEERLNDFLDGVVSDHDRQVIVLHLEACPQCRNDAAAYRLLLNEAGALPAGAAPPRDLWPGIRQRIERRKIVPLRFRVVRYGFRLPRGIAVAAAATLLVAASSVLTALFLNRDDRNPQSGNTDLYGGRVALTAFQSAETDYAEATRQLLAAYEARRSRLSPETIRVVEENLRIIDNALQNSRAALEADPGNRSLSDLTAAAYQKKVDFLRRTLSLSS